MDFFNTNIISRHDDIMMLNSWQVDHYNFMLGLSWISDADRSIYEEEKATYLCYDV